MVIFFGGLNKRRYQDSEGNDRQELGLPYGQDAVIEALCEANPRTAIVIVSGNAVAMPWIEKANAVVQGWYLGSEAGNAIANVLSGKVNPSGKLPFTYYASVDQCGAHVHGEESYPGVIDEVASVGLIRPRYQQRYVEDIFVGYRWTDLYNCEPTFPFGHGLSYTTFEYGKLSLNATSRKESGKITASVKVTNTGSVKGGEVVQLYIGDDVSTVERPVRELKGFKKVFLAPGESTVVEFEIDRSALSFFDAEKHDWVAEKGMFTAYVGSSSRDLRDTAQFELK